MGERETSEFRDLQVLIDAARLEVEKRMIAESGRVDGEITASRLWWELRSLGQVLDRASHHAALIERITVYA